MRRDFSSRGIDHMAMRDEERYAQSWPDYGVQLASQYEGQLRSYFYEPLFWEIGANFIRFRNWDRPQYAGVKKMSFRAGA